MNSETPCLEAGEDLAAPNPVKSTDPTQFTIGQAIKKYEREGVKSMSPALRAIISRMIDSGTQTEFSNDSYLDALYLTDVMFHRSHKSVQFLTGSGVEGFLKALESSFEEMLKRFRKTGGKAQVVLLNKEIPARLDSLQKIYSDVFELCRAVATDESIRHFIICDGRMARVEEPHPPLTNDTPATAIKAKVFFNEPEQAEVLEKYFSAVWETVKKFTINKVN